MKARARHKMRKGRAACALACLVLGGLPLNALDPAATIAQYAHSRWMRENSPLLAGVRALAQTEDGNLWIGTDSGLLHFDGVRFQPWRPPDQLPGSQHILALAAARDASLWIGTREGLSHWDGTHVRNYQTSKGLTGPVVVDIRVDRAGTVWAATAGYRSGGLCRVDSIGLRCYGATDGLPDRSVLSLLEDRHGSLWVGHLGLCKWESGCSHYYPSSDRSEIHAIAQDSHDGLWIAGTGLKKLSDGKFIPYPLPGANHDLQVRALLSDRQGALWIGTLGQGLWRVYQGRIDRFTYKDGLSNDYVRSLLEDAEGNIWVGTDGGLDRFREYAVTTILRNEGGPPSAISSVFGAKDGGVWIGTASGLRRLRDGQTIAYDQRDGLPSVDIMGVFEEQSGRLWVQTRGGLAYWEAGGNRGRFRRFDLPSGEQMILGAAVEQRDHSVWLSDLNHGMIRLRNARVTDIVPWSRFENKQALSLASDPANGDLWLGFNQGGIACYRQGQVHWYAADRPNGAAVLDLHLARDGSLWVATQTGLSRIHQGRVVSLGVSSGLPPDGIRAMVEDDQEALWLDMTCGLVRIARDDLSAWSANPSVKIHPKIFDAGDGMHMGHTSAGYFRRAAKSGDGRLWFAVFDGVAVVNPHRLPENRRPPPVRIEGVVAGQTAYSTAQSPRLPPLTRELRIDYTAMSFVNPDRVKFRYRLDGFDKDKDWHDATTRQAVYMNLPPRNYRFRVIACNDDGIWNETGASLDFWIAPAYYQTIWFRLACFVAVAVVLWSLDRLRLQRVGARMNARFQERLAERTRIAREVHDTLLQSLTGFALQLKGLAKTATLAPPVKDRLEEICHDAETCSRQAREIVWDLRAPTLEEQDLSQTLRQALEEIVGAQPVECRVTVNGTPRPAPVELQQHLLRIVQEATRNAVRYSQAKEIGMHIAYLEPDLIRVQMRDDGCGFDLEHASLKTGHWGLITMRERAKQMGAEFKISSAPGQGTEIEILVACTPA